VKLILWASLATLFYVYVGYGLLLLALARVRRRPVMRDPEYCPRVTMLISAYNEADVIRAKIENTLALDYPSDRLEIVVCSDASDDGTDVMVDEYRSRGVVLRRQRERLGKTAGLNAAVPQATGEIIVFSDANAMYEPNAVRNLVRNFADPSVGCVTGESRYVAGNAATADRGERAYWTYEIKLKRLESAVGSMVGGDGAVYAIRKELWQELPETAINDFLNPLQIVAAGWRAIYEPEAICYERTAGELRREFARRVRIVSRSWRAVFQAPAVLNPFKVGFFALQVVSHKLLRWLSVVYVFLGAFALLSFVATSTPYRVELAAFAFVIASMYLVAPMGRRIDAFASYFLVINVASFVGVVRGSFGRVSPIWSTVREHTDATSAAPFDWRRTAGRAVVWLAATAGVVALTAVLPRQTVTVAFWGSGLLLAYVYVGYPLVLLAMQQAQRGAPRRKAAIEPHVTVLIAAHNEGDIISAKLENSVALEYPRDKLEIVVASDGSRDATNAIVRSFAARCVRLVEFPTRRGKVAAINDAMRTIDSEVVVFTDANVFIRQDAIRHLVSNFADPRVGAVSGDVILVGERAALARSEDLYYRYERWLQKAESDVGSMIGVDGALYAIRRTLFVPPAEGTILDDMAIPMAIAHAGYRVVFDPMATGLEQGSRSALEEFARKSRIVAGAVQFVREQRARLAGYSRQVLFSLASHKVLRWISPLLALIAIGAAHGLALLAGSRPYAVAAALQMLLIAAGLAGCAPRLRRFWPIGLAHYFCVVHAAAAVGFVRGVMGFQLATWRRFARTPLEAQVQ
jgi:cellulose synthase/poly-beta-1,6-N-acetylglucosamine synthase-like glycosyltransferase